MAEQRTYQKLARALVPVLLAGSVAACDTVEGVGDWFGFDAPEDRETASEPVPAQQSPYAYPSIPGEPYVPPGQRAAQQQAAQQQQAFTAQQYAQQVPPAFAGQQGNNFAQAYAAQQQAYLPDANPAFAGAASAVQADFTNIAGDRIFFDSGSSALDPKAHEVLVRQADWLRRRPNVTATLIGHADGRGTETQNLVLGQRRADAARDYMIALGIAPERLTAVSFGSRQPYQASGSSSAQALNRRVVTVVNPN
jgi:peptidoglycan-associated lipoprotein